MRCKSKAIYFIIWIPFLLLYNNFLFGQELFYSSIIKGGVTGLSFSFGGGSGSITKSVSIPIGSTIQKAFLISAHNKLSSSIIVYLNGKSILLSNNTDATSPFIALNDYGTCILNNSKVNVVNITSIIEDTTNNYTLTVPVQNDYCKNGNYAVFYLYIVFKNNSFLRTSYNIFLNSQNISNNLTYNLKEINPIDNSTDVGLSFCGYYFNDTILKDGTFVTVNDTSLLGLVGGDENSYVLSGVSGDFMYYNENLLGLGNDTPDSLMTGVDALANIKNYVMNSDTALSLNFKYQRSYYHFITNPICAIFLTYSTPCDPFPVSVSPDTTLCAGETVQLHASGGIKYEWASTALSPQSSGNPAPGLSCSDCANPVFTGDSSQVYTVRIWSTDSCSVVRPVRVGVRRPKNNVFIAAPSDCISPTGIISYNEDAATWNGISSWQLVNENGDTITSNQKSIKGLAHGTYYLTLTDTFGCKSAIDTLTILPNNNTVASFQATPLTGTAPFTVAINNSSVHANQFEWFINGVFQGSSLPQFQIDTSGYYTILLVASQNGICLDTVGELVYAKEGLLLTIPQLLTPNGDYKNDTWKITGIEKYPHNEVTVFNRWGNVVFHQKNYQNNWNGITNVIAIGGKDKLPNGTYFYVVKIQNKGKEQVFKGYLEVER